MIELFVMVLLKLINPLLYIDYKEKYEKRKVVCIDDEKERIGDVGLTKGREYMAYKKSNGIVYVKVDTGVILPFSDKLFIDKQ